MSLKLMQLPTVENAVQVVNRTLGSRTTAALGVVAGYLLLCRSLRYLRKNRRHAQYPYKTREDFAKMNAEDAWQIVRYCMSAEFPFMCSKALSFALFRTYGIPSISKLLCETRQFSEAKNASRRYVDTAVLIVEFLGNSPTSLRANSAIARMNYLHARHQKAGKISNDDMLFTLALFVLEIERWVGLYEWRPLTPMEICAFGTHWKSVGDAMGIQFDDLAHGPAGFKDGFEFFENLKEWSASYEKRCMVPNKWNHKVAEETVSLLLADVPMFMQPSAKHVVTSLMDERLRQAMIYDAPPPIYPLLVSYMLETRKLFVRYLMLPRPWTLLYRFVTEYPDPKTGRYYTTEYTGDPWYIKPTFWERYSPYNWFRWSLGRSVPDGKNYKPQGFTVFEVGPVGLEKHGHNECAATRDHLMSSNRGGCPFR